MGAILQVPSFCVWNFSFFWCSFRLTIHLNGSAQHNSAAPVEVTFTISYFVLQAHWTKMIDFCSPSTPLHHESPAVDRSARWVALQENLHVFKLLVRPTGNVRIYLEWRATMSVRLIYNVYRSIDHAVGAETKADRGYCRCNRWKTPARIANCQPVTGGRFREQWKNLQRTRMDRIKNTFQRLTQTLFKTFQKSTHQ